jgi:hypothetical protein
MSRGLGKIQRRILDVLQLEAGQGAVPTSLLTVFVFMDDKDLAEYRAMGREIQLMTLVLRRVDPWKRNTVSRACNQLWRNGLIQAFDTANAALWALPQSKKPKRKKPLSKH